MRFTTAILVAAANFSALAVSLPLPTNSNNCTLFNFCQFGKPESAESEINIIRPRSVGSSPRSTKGRQNTEKRLEAFFQTLNTYVNETYFDVSEFELKLPEMRQKLTDIERLARMSLVYEKMADKFAFIKYKFHMMAESVKTLRTYNAEHGLASHVVHCLIQLNIRLLALYNSRGIPNSEAEGYRKAVELHYQYLQFWYGTFERLTHVPAGVEMMFKNQVNRAHLSLRVLQSQLYRYNISR